MEPCWLLLFICASWIWLLLYCLCPVPVVLTHSYHGVPSQETSCSEWCTVWWADQTMGRAPLYTVHSGTLASHHSPHSTAYTCHSSGPAGHLETVVKKKKKKKKQLKNTEQQLNKLGIVVKQKLETVVKQKCVSHETVKLQNCGREINRNMDKRHNSAPGISLVHQKAHQCTRKLTNQLIPQGLAPLIPK